MEVDVSQSHLRTFGIALLALLAFPSAGRADLIDFIWDMSGPQMVGKGLIHCEYDLQASNRGQGSNRGPDSDRGCKYAFRDVSREGQRLGLWRITLDTTAYLSTGKSAGGNQYKWGSVGMVAVEPMLEVRSCCTDNKLLSVHHGVGLSYDFLFGQHFSRFNKFGLKITPLGIKFNKKISAAYNVRLYPHKFTPDEFGFGPRLPDLSRGFEKPVQGVSIYFSF
jgi:hypothetical protein